jgi:hypothetical protein
MKPFLTTALIICIFTLIGCDKKGDSLPEPPPLQVEEFANTDDTTKPLITISGNTTVHSSRSQLNHIFDWEQTQQMPVYPGQPAVPVPWSEEAVRNYDPGLRYDYKKSDGWELVYNSFSDSLHMDNRVFMLYNKFRGLLRYYIYNTAPGNPSVDSYRSLINEIQIYSSNSPLLNYAGQFIVDMSNNASFASLIEPWFIREGGWYISQFEMAYDRNVTNYMWPNNSMAWNLSFARIEELWLNDYSAKSKTIYLEKPGLRFSDGSARGPAIGGNMQAHIKAINGIDELSGLFSGATISKLKQSINDSTSGNLLNAMLSPGQNLVDCKLDLTALFRQDYNLVGFTFPNFAQPGMDNSRVIGFGPVFNEPLGIFYLAKKPVVRHVTTGGGVMTDQYTLDISSIEYVINPFTRQYADVRNFRQEIVAIGSMDTPNLTEAKMYKGKILRSSAPIHLLGVRVSFEVVPKNGSAPIKIIKTFKADVKEG